jgi:beta-aspartyl-peptidase (threonine type)
MVIQKSMPVRLGVGVIPCSGRSNQAQLVFQEGVIEMRSGFRFCAVVGLIAGSVPAILAQQAQHHWEIVVHGGAGVIERSQLGPEGDKAYREGLDRAVHAGAAVLDNGGSALDAVEATLHVLEDDPHFNAGKGAVFTREGKNEMDASIMDGATLRAGAVAGVQRVHSPISAARAVMEKSPHVMIAGRGADEFAASVGLKMEEPSYFFTESRWQGLVKELKKKKGMPIPPRPAGVPAEGEKIPVAVLDESETSGVHGTTGVVVLDRNGNVAAGTSTGGMQAKMPGRIGDSPIIGAGTYASNQSCAVSGTGTGEYFIRLGVAREVCNLVYFRHMKLQDAVDEVIHKELEALQGDGGVIAITPDGQQAWSFNTPGMFRAKLVEGGQVQIGIYRDEP